MKVSWRVDVWPAAVGAVLGAFPGVWRFVWPVAWDVIAGLGGEWSVALGSTLGALAGLSAVPLVGLTLTIASGAIGVVIALVIVLIVLAVIYCIPGVYFGWPPFN